MDIQVENHGSIFLVKPLTNKAIKWLQENTNGQWLGNALACEPRYIEDLVEGLYEEGFEII